MKDLMIRDSELLQKGKDKISWTRLNMPLLKKIGNEFANTKPFKGLKIGVSLHIEQKTAVLLLTLQKGGAEIVATGNLRTTQNDVALALNDYGIKVFGKREDTKDEHFENIRNVLRQRPTILLDNGADLIHFVVNETEFSTKGILGGTEETTSGGIRIREKMKGKITFPIIVVNDSPLKMIVENKHGVGQSIVESFSRISNLMIIGKKVTIFGYGWCGRGIAGYFKSFGAQVVVVETDSIRALEATVDGFLVMEAKKAIQWGKVIITATGRPDVIKSEYFDQMQDGVILANSGHFDWEIDVPALRSKAISTEKSLDSIEHFTLANGKKIILFCEGRMYNLEGVEAKGNTIETMDMGFTLQALSLQWVALGAKGLVNGAQAVPNEVNYETADLMLRSLS
ncbi:adenosylhomocysteinase [Aquimarina algiphila]|uniref:adenosylhomocysteinase n=1 Tax=Aquimarina algiphila TaxID=2047982 RepID=UPI00249223A8|nr:adenosylhomocysteinase [Aquimarina algiphila]